MEAPLPLTAVAAFVVLSAQVPDASADEPKYRAHAEVDPFPFVRSGYGGQVGIRGLLHPNLRFAIASFALDVPDVVTELGGNEGFHLRVRPSFAFYGFYYFGSERGGWAVGGSVRYLRQRYTHDDVPGQRTDLGEVSVEALGGYKWHPFRSGFYLQPWGGVAVSLARTEDLDVGDQSYDPLPVQLFATVNIGWDLAW